MQIKRPSNGDSQSVSLKDSLKKSIRCKPNEYKVIFHSKSILLSQAIAEYLYDELRIQKTTTLLIDLSEEEVDDIFNEIVCKKSIQLLQNPKKQTKLETKRLNQVVKQKRTDLYKTAGVYSVSSQVFLKDLIRFQKIIELKTINRIIIRISQKISSFYNKFGWIFTLLKKESKNCSVIIICRNVHFYSDYDSLQGLYRSLFCQKLVIWPFGRSQIHKSIQKVCQTINELKHYLDMTDQMKKNEQIIRNLLQIVEKQYNKFRAEKKNGLQILYKQWIGQELNDQPIQVFEEKDFSHLKYLMNCIQNTSQLHFLNALLRLRNHQNEKSIWNSGNSIVVDLIEQAVKNCKAKIYSIQKIESEKEFVKVNLSQLIMGYHYEREQNQVADKYHQWDAIYDLQYRIKPSLHRNHKILQTFECIDQILEQIHNNLKFSSNNNEQRIEQQFLYGSSKDNLSFHQTLLINCPSTFIRNYVHKQLFCKINDNHYIQYLRSLYDFLRIERQLRIVNIKSIFNKIKQKARPQKMEIQQPRQIVVIKLENKNLQQPIKSKNQNFEQQNKQSFEQNQSNSLLEAFQILDQESKQIKDQCEQIYSKNETIINKKSLIQEKVIEKENLVGPYKNKQEVKNKKTVKQIFKENTFILEQSLYRQLSILFSILPRYENLVFTDQQITINVSNTKSTDQQLSKTKSFQQPQVKNIDQNHVKSASVKELFKGQSQFYEKQFQSEIQKINFNFIDRNLLKIVPHYNEQSKITFYSKTNSSQKVLIVSIFASKGSASVSDRVTEFNQAIKLSNPHRVIFYSPHSWQIRNLYITASEGHLANLKQIRVLAYKNSFQVQTAEHQVKKEDEAFWKISQNRSKLSEYKQNPELRIKDLQMNDKYQKTVDFINYAIRNDPKTQQKPQIYRLNLHQRRIIIDSRQFKSSLPCHLFFYGFTVIPIQLETADYILSDGIGVEKKSVKTKDLHQSLKSFRLDNQIRRMCQKFLKPYLLIQCDDIQDFRRESFFYASGTGSKDGFRTFVRQRLAELVKKFPRLRILWSESVARTCEYFKQLKRDQPEPQIGKYMKNDSEQLEKAKALQSDQQQEAVQKEKEQLFISE